MNVGLTASSLPVSINWSFQWAGNSSRGDRVKEDNGEDDEKLMATIARENCKDVLKRGGDVSVAISL